jgi:hypothetical protein
MSIEPRAVTSSERMGCPTTADPDAVLTTKAPTGAYSTMTRQLYATGLMTSEPIRSIIEDASSGPEWEIRVLDDRTNRFWFDDHGESSSKFPVPEKADDGMRPCGHLHVSADTQEDAEAVQRLVWIGAAIQCPDPPDGRPLSVYPIDDRDPEKLARFETGWLPIKSCLDLRLALHGVVTARRAWSDPGLIYALEKWAFSWWLDSMTVHTLHPGRGEFYGREKKSPEYHVSAAAAVNAAYSAIEELSCEVRSSPKKKRFHEVDGKREWNPVVYHELRGRLEKRGVDITLETDWMVRGERLRNFVTAHRFCEESRHVGPYDVHNVQATPVFGISLLRIGSARNLGTWVPMMCTTSRQLPGR